MANYSGAAGWSSQTENAAATAEGEEEREGERELGTCDKRCNHDMKGQQDYVDTL